MKLKKSPILYVFMFIVWIALAVLLWLQFVYNIKHIQFTVENVSNTRIVLGRILLVLNALFITYFWLNGVKDFIYVIWYYIFKRKLAKSYQILRRIDISGVTDRVLMLYCTCNDFDEDSLAKSMQQKYKNVKTVILDDSTDRECKERIDDFSKVHGIKVIRRSDRKGFKAGNINNYLMREEVKNSYDYVVILDSDEILPCDYIEKALRYFYCYNNVGIVQANHISTRNRNFFMKLFHIGVNSHWPTYQGMKNRYGFSTMLGHGAMIKRDCYLAAGGFPNLVAEDLCISIEAREHGYLVAFAADIICEEEYPVDYVAFKKRHSKWTQGNLEFIKKYTAKIIKSKMKWYEKADIVLFTYNLPLTAIFAFHLFLNLIFLPVLAINAKDVYSFWMLIPTIIFFFSPMLNDFISWFGKLNPLRFFLYFICVIILYGSMLTTSLTSALLGVFGKKAKFIVTPKTSGRISFGFALRFQIKEILFSMVLIVVSLLFDKSVLPVVLISVTGILSVFLLFFSNKKYSYLETKKIDEVTRSITLKKNKTIY